MLKIELYAQTHLGLLREKNEDSFCIQRYFKPSSRSQDTYVYKTSHETMAAVFDGIGGESHGEMASFIASKTTARFDGTVPDGDWNVVLDEINGRINDFAEHFQCSTGSTAAMVHYCDGCIDICNLGDSRIYLFREGKLRRLSKDHTELQLALDMNLANLPGGGKKGKLTKYLGIQNCELNPYMQNDIQITETDMLLICSDGLTDMVEEEQIGSIMASYPKHEITDTLIQQALHNGGKDNVTVIAIAFEEKISWMKKLFSKK